MRKSSFTKEQIIAILAEQERGDQTIEVTPPRNETAQSTPITPLP